MNKQEFIEKSVSNLRHELESIEDVYEYHRYIHCEICPIRKKCNLRTTKFNCGETISFNIDEVE